MRLREMNIVWMGLQHCYSQRAGLGAQPLSLRRLIQDFEQATDHRPMV